MYLFALMLYFGLLTSWYFAYTCDFFYPVTYQMLYDDDKYFVNMPQDADRVEYFEYLGSGTHLKVFMQILQGVEHKEHDFSDITFNYKDSLVPVAKAEEIKQLEDVRSVMNNYKSLHLPMLVMLLMTLSIMIYYEFQPYDWHEFTREMSWAYAVSICLVWLMGVDRFFNLLLLMSSSYCGNWFFRDGDSLLGVVVPFPWAYVSFIFIIATSGLAFWAILYKTGSSVIKFFIDKNYL